MNYFESEPMKYWSASASMSPTEKRIKLESMIDSGDYIWSRKYDGNWSRAVITKDRAALQTRGISVKTKTYGEIQDKVFFWDDVIKAFPNGDTVILAEVYLPGGIDKDCGSILRCLKDKALARQKDNKLEWRIFDVLVIDGTDMFNTPVEERVKHIPEVVKRINNPLVKGIEYHEMDDNFFDDLAEIFADGGEGCVCYKKDAIYIPGKRGPHAWDSLKVKQEVSSDIDCFILAAVPCEKNYNGGDIGNWQYWENTRTGEKLVGGYFGDYQSGVPLIPISKNYYYNWPASITVGVYDNKGNIVELCKVAGLTEEFKSQLRDNFNEWKMCPVSISGMMVSTANANIDGTGISIRHPILRSIRREDIDPKDCTLTKIID